MLLAHTISFKTNEKVDYRCARRVDNLWLIRVCSICESARYAVRDFFDGLAVDGRKSGAGAYFTNQQVTNSQVTSVQVTRTKTASLHQFRPFCLKLEKRCVRILFAKLNPNV